MTHYVIDFDFDSLSFGDLYDELPLWSAAFGQFLLEHLPLHKGMSLLDIGCGTGFPLLELAGRLGNSSHIVGLDIWFSALRRAGRKRDFFERDNVSIIHYDGGTFPFADASFDCLVSNLGVNNFDNPEGAMNECYRLTKSGGRLALTTNLIGHMREFYAIFHDVLIDFNNPNYIQALAEQEAHRGTVETHSALIENSGYQIDQVVEHSFNMRYADGSALFQHPFIRFGFLPSWVNLIDLPDRPAIFEHLEARLNAHAQAQGDLRLTIPMVYISAIKPE